MNAKVNISNRAGASFPVRRMDFEFAQVPRYWANYDAGLTHFMTALSALSGRRAVLCKQYSCCAKRP